MTLNRLYSPAEICESASLSLCTFNVLLPHAWWVPKYYDPALPPKCWGWEHRQKLLKQQLTAAPFDVLALQEVAPDSFAQDFEFLWSDYDGFYHRRSRISAALCWRRGRLKCLEQHHLDRSVVAVLQDLGGRVWVVASVHLSAGPQPRRRLQQIAATLKRFERIGCKHNVAGFLIAGDFNSHSSDTAVRQLLQHGVLSTDFREAEHPELELSSKTKSHHLGGFRDCYEANPVPTMWVRDLLPVMLDQRPDEPIKLSDVLCSAIEELFEKFGSGAHLDSAAQERWLISVNGAVQGIEADLAAELSGPMGLSREQFIRLHEQIVLVGHHWSVDYALRRSGIELPVPTTPRTYRLDRIWMCSQEFVADRQMRPAPISCQPMLDEGACLPNEWHCSDHLPLGIRLMPKVTG